MNFGNLKLSKLNSCAFFDTAEELDEVNLIDKCHF